MKYIVTGASDVLGKEFAQLAIENGAEIVCISRTKPDYDCVYISADLTDEKSLEQAINEIKENHPKFDAIVNCAGAISLQEPHAIKYDELDNLMKLNVSAPIFITSRLFNEIKENHADIINVGSTAGYNVYSNHCTYNASKWGLRGVTKNMQLELKNSNSRVILFSPGGMQTKIFEKALGKEKDVSAYMDPKEIAKIMFYTLSLPKGIEVSEIIMNRKN